jgi:stage II sporulation protein M
VAWNLKTQQYLKDHLPLYVFVSVLFVMGVIFGSVMVNALSLEQREEITRFFGNFFHVLDSGNQLNTHVTFQQVFGMQMKWTFLIWILGLSIVGFPLILVLDFLKGVLVGFTVGYLAGQLSWKGMLFALVSVAPQNLIIIPVLIVISVTAMGFSLLLIKNRFLQRKGGVYQPFMRYSGLTLAMAAVLFGVSLFEAYVSPVMMHWVSPMLEAYY